MKLGFAVTAFSFLTALLVSPTVTHAAPKTGGVLTNCLADRGAEFFASDLEKIATEKATPVLVTNDKNEVVGVISVSPKRAKDYPHKAKVVEVNQLRLCGTFEVNDFYYAEDEAANLLTWADNSISITQDEGMIEIDAKVLKQESYATLIEAEFKTYDVFGTDDNGGYSPEVKRDPDFVEDWGLPTAKGKFYFRIPKNWSLK